MLVRELLQKSQDNIKGKHHCSVNDLYTLLGAVLQVDKVHLFTLFNQEISSDKIEQFNLLFTRYINLEPLQYIIGYTYFYGLKFLVDSRVLIPRYDSEIIVDTILKDNQDIPLKVLDLGTGSGNLAISLKKLRPSWKIVAIDNSIEALQVAQSNASMHQVEIEFVHADMLDYLKHHPDFDLIVCNPPYIDIEDYEVDEQVRRFEPHSALYASDNGLFYYHRIIDIHPSSLIYFEIGYQQKQKIIDRARDYEVQTYQDLSGLDRLIKLKLKTNDNK